MGLKALLDTNTVIYVMSDLLAEPLPPGDYFVSAISEIELLSYPRLDTETEARIRSLLSSLTVIELVPAIKVEAIRLRRRHSVKVPDAIIAATAIVFDLELLTADQRLSRLSGLRLRTLPLKSQPSP